MEKRELLEYICEWFNIPECNQMILNQIYKFTTERRYTYKEIARALSFYIDVQGKQPELKYGIAIVPFVMEDARKFFKQKELEKQRQLEAAKSHQQDVATAITINCNPKPRKTIKKKQIDISNLEQEDYGKIKSNAVV